MQRRSFTLDYSRQPVKGIFFLKHNANHDDCRKLVQELGCHILLENASSLTIQTSRARLKELKERHLDYEDDKSNISSRLREHFNRILIGGNARVAN